MRSPSGCSLMSNWRFPWADPVVDIVHNGELGQLIRQLFAGRFQGVRVIVAEHDGEVLARTGTPPYWIRSEWFPDRQWSPVFLRHRSTTREVAMGRFFGGGEIDANRNGVVCHIAEYTLGQPGSAVFRNHGPWRCPPDVFQRF